MPKGPIYPRYELTSIMHYWYLKLIISSHIGDDDDGACNASKPLTTIPPLKNLLRSVDLYFACFIFCRLYNKRITRVRNKL